MNAEGPTDEIVTRAAAAAGVPADVLLELLGLESEFRDFSIQGVKTAFAGRVADILERAAEDAAA